MKRFQLVALLVVAIVLCAHRAPLALAGNYSWVNFTLSPTSATLPNATGTGALEFCWVTNGFDYWAWENEELKVSCKNLAPNQVYYVQLFVQSAGWSGLWDSSAVSTDKQGNLKLAEYTTPFAGSGSYYYYVSIVDSAGTTVLESSEIYP